jgi:hypothetical protein
MRLEQILRQLSDAELHRLVFDHATDTPLVETWREAYRIEESTNEILTAVMRERQRRDPRLLDTPF